VEYVLGRKVLVKMDPILAVLLASSFKPDHVIVDCLQHKVIRALFIFSYEFFAGICQCALDCQTFLKSICI